jgi:hypothetical protein
MITQAFLSERTLKTVANYRSERWTSLANISRQDGEKPITLSGKPTFARLARGRKRHYTFARRVFDRFRDRTGKVNKPFQGLDSLVKFR